MFRKQNKLGLANLSCKKMDSGATVCKKNTETHYDTQIVAKKKETEFNGNVARCMVFETAFPNPYVS